MKTKFTISNDYGQLNNEIDLDLTPEEMLDLLWIVMVTIHELDINEVRMHLDILRSRPNFYPPTSEDLINV
jgi:hypothetical protein